MREAMTDQAVPGEAQPVEFGAVTLSDGRSLAWTAWGVADGVPVLSQPHTGVSGRRALASDVEPVSEAGIRLIEVCRAGLGASSPLPGRTAHSDAEDMLQLADALDMDRVNLLAQCGGAGAALAFAARWPVRVANVGLVSPMAPLAGPRADSYTPSRLRMLRRLMRFGPVARWAARRQKSAYARDPDAYLEQAHRLYAEADRALLQDPSQRAMERAAWDEFIDVPVDAYIDEWRAVIGPWDIGWLDIRARVVIDHGEEDQIAPVAMARWLASQVPSAVLHIDPDRGHFIQPTRLAALLRRLVLG
jgi:pimeloyl-ACP methyl ester carboxylesterase